jgi:hypothetical protein
MNRRDRGKEQGDGMRLPENVLWEGATVDMWYLRRVVRDGTYR